MKATIVSAMPRPIENEHKPHIEPSWYNIAAAPKDDIAILVISDAEDKVYAGEGRFIERPVFAIAVAKDIVDGFINSQLGISEGCKPALFCVEGEFTSGEIKTKFKNELLLAQLQQKRWFASLVRIADDDWARTRQHKTISDLQRDACKILNLERDWNVSEFNEVPESQICPACGSKLPNSKVTKCATCQTIIKPEQHAKLFGLVTK